MYPYFGYAYPYRTPDVTSWKKYIKNNERFLSLLNESIRDERMAQQFYGELFQFAITPFERSMIQHAFVDERKHEQMLLQVYRNLEGRDPELPHVRAPEVREFTEGVKKAFLDELEAQETYREMMLLVSGEAYALRDYLFEIWSDEVEHAQRFTYIRAERT
ncbi:hypothetical protein DNHGIG_24170 [Collibacillus ludicampi]|uniref:Rubrerythrin diiron-binding domain-containing protein n=1 Tax=Collibacillus ludicampi TaxID=2771369 RepID=A0AAV4LGH0_9BACL|nr:ferritin-like domain-containing protein [Collibacillus ludicampi]GIM46868.1 hypothetical protein DNHGIG_24170 [Collibacillus ludicampi]